MTPDTWRGDNNTGYQAQIQTLAEEYSTIYKQLDASADDVRDAITQRENNIYEHNGALGEFQKLWNNLCSWIDKWGK